ncbi:hypothetical protein AK812_SmicGene41967 [Symbiodinium microadriaticum]|uniref:Uncharacterized protein n=1 Tax=Symbiodinium microadriaticum TaxID=2951 RepID=A0A1Q9C4Q9_SYMMI|nr:hypothetical protein AK812_SmicGene41967 [Symbiodinium microadriaticum]
MLAPFTWRKTCRRVADWDEVERLMKSSLRGESGEVSAYFSAAVFALSLAFYPAVIGVGLYACDRWARDWWPSGSPVAVLQTVGIGLMVWILFALGTIASSIASGPKTRRL